MIYCLTGKLLEKAPDYAVVSCGGVGYLCTVSAQTYSQLPEPGEEVLLYTHLSVREDAMARCPLLAIPVHCIPV